VAEEKRDLRGGFGAEYMRYAQAAKVVGAKGKASGQATFVPDSIENDWDHWTLDLVEVFWRQAAYPKGVSDTFAVDTNKEHPSRGAMAIAGG
jgi:hypothetical protein